MIPTPLRFEVKAARAGERLDRFLAAEIAGQSRSQILTWIRKGCVLVNGSATKAGHLLRCGDVLLVRPPEAPPTTPFAEAIPLVVLYEDGDVAVIDKQAGIACHAGPGIRTGTLVNALLFRFGDLDAGDPKRPGIVHRLDKNTSGVMVVAKNGDAHRNLSLQFKHRAVEKEYQALVFGTPREAAGTVAQPIGRDPHNRKKMSIRARHKRAAVTHYRVIRTFESGKVSLLELNIATGRTHQIRVHLAHLGCPVVGDALYGVDRTRVLTDPKIRAGLKNLGRHFLHASRLAFRHPTTGDRMVFVSPLPPELTSVLQLVSGSEDG